MNATKYTFLLTSLSPENEYAYIYKDGFFVDISPNEAHADAFADAVTNLGLTVVYVYLGLSEAIAKESAEGQKEIQRNLAVWWKGIHTHDLETVLNSARFMFLNVFQPGHKI